MKKIDCWQDFVHMVSSIDDGYQFKMEFAEYFMKKNMGIESNEDSKIAIGPLSSEVMISFIASILIEWESLCNTGN